MTNAKVHEGFRVDKKVEEYWSKPLTLPRKVIQNIVGYFTKSLLWHLISQNWKNVLTWNLLVQKGLALAWKISLIIFTTS